MKNSTENTKAKDTSANQILPEIQYVVFKLGTEEYGIKIEKVKEVTIAPDIAKMPKTSSFIKGIANIRGDIITIMDLEEKFGIKNKSISDNKKRSYILVVEAPQYTMGLIVNDVPQSLSIPLDKIDKTTHIIQEKGINESFIEGIGKVNGRLIIILDIMKILSIEEMQTVLSAKS